MNVEKFTNGESKNVEFKATLPAHSINYTKTVVAFANGVGGRIIFGVQNGTWQVTGVPDDQVFIIMDSIADAIAQSCKPLIVPDITMQDVDGKTIIVVDVAPGSQRPYHIKSLGIQNGTYIRAAGTTQLADDAMIRELMFEGDGRSFDQSQCLELTADKNSIDALCKLLTDTARANAGTRSDTDSIKPVGVEQLLSWGVLLERNGKLQPTNAYALLTGSSKVRSVVQCGVFKGTTKAVFVDRREFSGPPQDLVEETYQFVLRNIHLGAEFKGVYRQDVYEIPPDAIRELIVNAVVHRSYIDHSSIQVAIYDNRLEVTSPGRLPIGQTIERMKQGYSKIRNEALASAFSYMGIIEHWGSGILRIREQLRNAGLSEPEFLGGDTDLRINIYRRRKNGKGNGSKSATVSGKTVPENTGKVPAKCRQSAGKVPANDSAEATAPDFQTQLSNQQTQIVNYVRHNGGATSAQVMSLLGVGNRRARALLTELMQMHALDRIGASRSTRYVVHREDEQSAHPQQT